ncbi:MAG: gliding motility protein GldL [Bacteroidales bacterium]|nr:gliding motility protein GldL [Bacteroidales bacterium]
MANLKRTKTRIAEFLYGESGQRFFNFAYSIGAAIVIWGALFKILHLPGGNMLLSIGMGTEVLMFILTAFDRPARDYKWEKVYPALADEEAAATEAAQPGAGGSQVIITGGTAPSGPITINAGAAGNAGGSVAVSGSISSPVSIPESPAAAVSQLADMAEEMQQLRESTRRLNEVSETLLASYKAITDNSDSINESSTGYVEQMQALNRNIQGLNTIYEIQLKSVSSQLDAIDRVNRGIRDICNMYEQASARSAMYCDEAEKMAKNMQQLNKVYERMLTAMTINMAPAMAAGFAAAGQQAAPDTAK